MVFYSASDERTEGLGGFEIPPEQPGVLAGFAENTLIEAINETTCRIWPHSSPVKLEELVLSASAKGPFRRYDQ